MLFAPDRGTPGTRHNPDPLAVHTGDYACYDVPDTMNYPAGPLNGLLVYLPIEAGTIHLKLRYVSTACDNVLRGIEADSTRLNLPWWGDYVR